MPQPNGDRAAVAHCYNQGIPQDFPVLSANTKCDALVIGAGVTGASTALSLAEAGQDVVLIDEASPGAGGSGRAFGQVVAFGKHSETWYRKTYGEERGQAIIDWLATGPDVVFDLIKKHEIQCSARRTGLFFAAHHPKMENYLRARSDYWADRGHPVQITEQDETWERIGSQFYDLSLWDKRAGSINPLAYTIGLAVAAQRAGTRVLMNTPATAIARKNGRWNITTPSGTINARTVAICTNAYSGNLWPRLKRSIVPVRSYQLVSKPVSSNLRRILLAGGQSITDTRRTFSAVRLFDDGRIHLSTHGPSFNVQGSADSKSANQRIADLFPQLESIEWDESWTGWVGINLEQEPRLSQLDDGLFGVSGFSGRGLAYGTLLGPEIAKRMIELHHPDAIFPLRPIFPLPAHSLAPSVVGQVLRYYSFLDDRELRVLRQKAYERGLPS